MNAATHRDFLNRPFEIDAGTTYLTMRLKLSIKSMERCTCLKLLPLRRPVWGYAGTLATLHHMTDSESSQLRGFLWQHSVQCRNEAAKDGTLAIRPREEQRSNQVARYALIVSQQPSKQPYLLRPVVQGRLELVP